MLENDELSTFTDDEADERQRWRRVEAEAQILCEPLARLIGHKEIVYALDVSGGQLTRELSSAYENRLSLAVGLFILRRSQNEKLARTLICDGAGYRLPEPQKRKTTEAEELAAIRAECREAGPLGQMLLERASRRARSAR